MIEITTGRHTTCDGITRRDALRVGALGLFGLTLPNLLQMQASAEEAKDVNCILLWLNGGPSHIDMFDPKPDAPNAKKFSVRDVTPPNGVDFARIERRRSVLSAIDNQQRRLEAARPIRTMDEFYARAYDMVTSPVAKKAFNLHDEPDKLREDYGRHTFGQSCLLARRLVEAGVRFVTINNGGWDTHTDNFKSLKNRRLPELDRGYAALLKDLHG